MGVHHNMLWSGMAQVVLPEGWGAEPRPACDGWVQVLLDAGMDVSKAARSGKTALMAAAEGGHRECVMALLEAGASPMQYTPENLGPVTLAARGGHREIVYMLLSAGGSVTEFSDEGETPLFAAVEGNHAAVAKVPQPGVLCRLPTPLCHLPSPRLLWPSSACCMARFSCAPSHHMPGLTHPWAHAGDASSARHLLAPEGQASSAAGKLTLATRMLRLRALCLCTPHST